MGVETRVGFGHVTVDAGSPYHAEWRLDVVEFFEVARSPGVDPINFPKELIGTPKAFTIPFGFTVPLTITWLPLTAPAFYSLKIPSLFQSASHNPIFRPTNPFSPPPNLIFRNGCAEVESVIEWGLPGV